MTTTVDPEDADYKCSLTEFSLKKAMEELNKDPKQRLGSVQTLRKWIRDQPHFTCRTDTTFLLAVLRRAKFSQLVARELINNILSARTNYKDYMTNLDIQDDVTLNYIDTSTIVFLPKPDKDGRRIILTRTADLKDARFNPKNDVRTYLGISEMTREADENAGVHGIVLVFDFTGFTLRHLQWATNEQNKITSKIYQDCNPERVKAFHFYNAGTLFEVLMGFAKTFFKKKNLERIHVHDSMESLYKVIPMELWPTEYLPDDYKGPSAGSMARIAADMKKRLMDPEVRAKVMALSSDRYRVDETKRPRDNAPNESFRKLNVD